MFDQLKARVVGRGGVQDLGGMISKLLLKGFSRKREGYWVARINQCCFRSGIATGARCKKGERQLFPKDRQAAPTYRPRHAHQEKKESRSGGPGIAGGITAWAPSYSILNPDRAPHTSSTCPLYWSTAP